MKIFVLAIFLLGCTGDHVVGSTSGAPDAPATGGSGGSSGTGGTGGTGGTSGTGGMMIDASTIDAFICGQTGEPCCPTGRACFGNLRCMNGVCR